MLEFIDTHCHIHFSDYPLELTEVMNRAKQEGVTRLLCVGCTLEDSQAGIVFAQSNQGRKASSIKPPFLPQSLRRHRHGQSLRPVLIDLAADAGYGAAGPAA